MRFFFFPAILLLANLLFQTNLLASGEYETLIREAELNGDRAHRYGRRQQPVYLPSLPGTFFTKEECFPFRKK